MGVGGGCWRGEKGIRRGKDDVTLTIAFLILLWTLIQK